MDKPVKKPVLNVREITFYAMMGALMFGSKCLMAALPNIHLIALFIIVLTVVFRWKALFPVYLYVLLEGVVYGFGVWFIGYLYVWAVLFGAVMLLPRKGPVWLRIALYSLAGGLHGILFGTMLSPVQAVIFGLDIKGSLAWIAAGFPYDVIHGISNAVLCGLSWPLIKLLTKLKTKLFLP